MAPINSAIQGLIQADRNVERTAERFGRAVAPPSSAGDTVSLSDQAVGLLTARDVYEANLQAVKVADNMTRKLIDILA